MPLVISPSLIVTPDAALSANRPIILYESLVTTSNLAADHEDADFPAVRLANPNTNDLWKSDDTGDQDIIVSLSGTDPVDAVGIARHNFGTAGITVSIEVDEGAGYSEVASLLPADDSPIVFLLDEVNPTDVKIHLEVGDTAPQAAVLFVGKSLRMEKGVQPGHTPINMGRERHIITGRSEAGDYLGRIESGGKLRSTANFKVLTPAFVRGDLAPFLEHGGPFFYAWRPVTYPLETGYVWCVNDPVPVPSTYAGFSDLTLELEGITT